jgi:cysteine-rich repeat protein
MIAPMTLIAMLLLAAPTAHAAICGNGTVEDGEGCDDGNRRPGDCCSATCKIEESRLGCAGECRCDTCDDEIDNDEDGLTDAADPECSTFYRLHGIAFSAGASDSLPGGFLSPPAPSRVEERTVISSDRPPIELACVADQPALDQPAAEQLASCRDARRIASIETEKVGRLAGAPVREIRVAAGQVETVLSFDSGTSTLAVDRLELAPGTTLRLVGEGDSTVVIQLGGELLLGSGARVVLDGGLRHDHVLWNANGADGAITLADRAELAGTLLAPGRAVSLGCGARVSGALHAEHVAAPAPGC